MDSCREAGTMGRDDGPCQFHPSCISDDTRPCIAEPDGHGKKSTEDTEPSCSSPKELDYFRELEDEPPPLPFVARWEAMRVARHCGILLLHVEACMKDYLPDYVALWQRLEILADKLGKTLPSRSDPKAWREGAINNHQSIDQVVIFKIKATPNERGTGFKLDLQPLQLDRSCYLHHTWRSSRFVQVEAEVKVLSHAADSICQDAHALLPKPFLGNEWTTLLVDEQHTVKKVVGQHVDDFALSGKTAETFKHLIFQFFATTGTDMQPCTRSQLLNKVFNLDKNQHQYSHKLYSSLKPLFSKTTPIMSFSEKQISHHTEDVVSPTGDIIKDGIGRVSLGVMERVRQSLGLDYVPSVIQGRIGSATGLWVLGVPLRPNTDVILIRPSMNEWACDWSREGNRILGVNSHSAPCRPGKLNSKLITILWDRAYDKKLMARVLVFYVNQFIDKEQGALKAAINSPERLLDWIHARERLLPSHTSNPEMTAIRDQGAGLIESMSLQAKSGFLPTQQRRFLECIEKAQKEEADRLMENFQVTIPQSTWAFIAVDFSGALEAGEVHIGFSNPMNVKGRGQFHIHGHDVLLGRSQAHLPSDIQKFKAVFSSELSHLKDVIMVSSKASIGLTYRGYDSDKAFICWDPEVVSNFSNILPSDLPERKDLSSFLVPSETKITDLKDQHGDYTYIDKWVEQELVFDIKQNYLGLITNHWELKCHEKTASHRDAVQLAYLLETLIGQPWRGFNFGQEEWHRFCREIMTSSPTIGRSLSHPIVDMINGAMRKRIEMHRHDIADLTESSVYDDCDLTRPWEDFVSFLKEFVANLWVRDLERNLESDLRECLQYWDKCDKRDWFESVRVSQEKWDAIDWRLTDLGDWNADGRKHAKKEISRVGSYVDILSLSRWALLKASKMFQMLGTTRKVFTWQMAERYLCAIKAQSPSNWEDLAIPVRANIYPLLKPDKKRIAAIIEEEKAEGAEEFTYSRPEDDLKPESDTKHTREHKRERHQDDEDYQPRKQQKRSQTGTKDDPIEMPEDV